MTLEEFKSVESAVKHVLELDKKRTQGKWILIPEVLDYNNIGSWGVPTVTSRAKVVIPEHFDAEADDNIDEIVLRTEDNAKFIASAPLMVEIIQHLQAEVKRKNAIILSINSLIERSRFKNGEHQAIREFIEQTLAEQQLTGE